tara:strand:+ start:25 stop:495 length:471 start_codon:yes stop_codon:yes gene_type:complete
MSANCKFCETQQSVVDKQTLADEDVANGKITEGEYLKKCDIIKKLYGILLEHCECDNKQVELEEDEILVMAVAITRNNIIELVGIPTTTGEGNFINEYMNKNVLVRDEVFDGNKKLVYGFDEYGDYDGNPFKHIYYDSNDNLFKEERDWTLRLGYL